MEGKGVHFMEQFISAVSAVNSWYNQWINPVGSKVTCQFPSMTETLCSQMDLWARRLDKLAFDRMNSMSVHLTFYARLHRHHCCKFWR
jgi:hypothetical protein